MQPSVRLNEVPTIECSISRRGNGHLYSDFIIHFGLENIVGKNTLQAFSVNYYQGTSTLPQNLLFFQFIQDESYCRTGQSC